jgi:DNA-directed RNA polymerase subunit beta'
MLKTTLGQLMINEALPEDMRDYSRELSKRNIGDLFNELAERHPDKYRDVAKALSDVGRDAAYSTGGQSFGLEDLLTPAAALASRARLNRRMRDIFANPKWGDDLKQEKIIIAAGEERKRLVKEVMEEAKAMGNPLAEQVMSGSRGKEGELNRLLGGDMLYEDHRDATIPFPVQRSYSEGLRPAEYWASTYGARKGLAAGKFATQDAGFFAKQLNQLAHRLLVTADGEDDEDAAQEGILRGLPVDVSDADNEGALLASPVGGYDRNTVLTPKIMQDLEDQGVKRILLRSPTVGGPRGGGVYARDAGIRETGRLPSRGDMVGLLAAQALSERLSQGQLSAKHVGGIKGESRATSGFEYLNQLVQTPKAFKGGAAHAQIDGRVTMIDDAPAGGKYIYVNGDRHYVSPGFGLKVKKGDEVEAGDIMSDGIPNPSEIVKHKGVGEGRRYFVNQFTEAYRDSGLAVSRRNVEMVARGLIDHVEVLDDMDDHIPGDVVPYSSIERNWKPRAGTVTAAPKSAIGKYLERPVLHYSIGTKIRPSMMADFDEFGVKSLDVHEQAPPFQPQMVRAMGISAHDPDWMARMMGSGQKKSLLEAVYRGRAADTGGTSFVPGLITGKDLSQNWPDDILKKT